MSSHVLSLRGAWTRLLDSWLPRRTKRLILLTSFSASVKKTPELDRQTLKKLNDLMGLCGSESAMKFPVRINRVIWEGKPVQNIEQELEQAEQLNEGRVAALILRIKANIPSWLSYEEDLLEQDFRVLLHNWGHVFR